MDSLSSLRELVVLELLASVLPKSVLEVSTFKDKLDSLTYIKNELNESGLEVYNFLKETEMMVVKKLDTLGVDPLTLVFTNQQAVSIRYRIVSNVSVHPGILGISYQLLSVKPLLKDSTKSLAIELVTKIMTGVDTIGLKEILAEIKNEIKEDPITINHADLSHVLKQLENIV